MIDQIVLSNNIIKQYSEFAEINNFVFKIVEQLKYLGLTLNNYKIANNQDK